MQVNVKLFAMLRDAAGVDGLTLDLPSSATAGDVVRAIADRYPLTGRLADRLAVAVNLEYVPLNYPLSDGCEVALIPPVSGG